MIFDQSSLKFAQKLRPPRKQQEHLMQQHQMQQQQMQQQQMQQIDHQLQIRQMPSLQSQASLFGLFGFFWRSVCLVCLAPWRR